MLALRASASATLAETASFSFGVIGHPFRKDTDETALRNAIAKTDDDNLSFVVANDIKAAGEPCTDQLYGQRKALMSSAKNGLIVSLSASGWVGCKTSADRSAALERLSRTARC